MNYRGTLYRALNPLWAREPLSGAGAARFGGRFNAKGMPALYTSLSPETAMREANQVGAFQPITLVAYEADLSLIFDATDPACLALANIASTDLADSSWRDIMLADGLAPTQCIARDLAAEGYAGILVPSYVPHASKQDRNLVLWTWGDDPSCKLRLIDDQGRLAPTM